MLDSPWVLRKKLKIKKKQVNQKAQSRTFQSKPTNPTVTYAKATDKNEENKQNIGGFVELNNVFKEIEAKYK